MTHPRFWIGPALFLACLLLGTWLRWVYPKDWILPNSKADQPAYSAYMVEADAYTRLIRVQNILDGKGLIQSFHPHENYPTGITPSTTLPFDLVILAIYPVMQAWSSEPLDWAGAVSAYLCFPVILALLYFWSGRMEWRWEARALLLAGAAVTPGFMWATPFGRPDHQALLLLLFTGGLTAELIRWQPDRKDAGLWAGLGGACWGFALWTSLFEPLILFPLILITNLIARRREQHHFLIAFFAVLVVAFLVEGSHLRDIVWGAVGIIDDEQTRAALGRWSDSINELRPLFDSFEKVTVNMGALIWLIPVTIGCLYRNKGLRVEHHLLVGLALLLTLCALFQTRWFYYATLGLLLLNALWMHREKVAYLRYGILALIAVSWIYSWSEMFDQRRSAAEEEAKAGVKPVFYQIKKLAELAKEKDSGSVIGPYWLSPAFSYYSGRPMVASSSHLTIEGILDTSIFYSTPSWITANKIADDREAGWVIAFEPAATQKVSEMVTGKRIDPKKIRGLGDYPVGFRLYLPGASKAVPTRYKLIGVQPMMRLYRIERPQRPSPTITP